MFEALRTTTLLGLLAAGIPAFAFAQNTVPGALPPGQTKTTTQIPPSQLSEAKPGPPAMQPAPMGTGNADSAHSARLDAQQRPITAGGFVKTGPIVF